LSAADVGDFRVTQLDKVAHGLFDHCDRRSAPRGPWSRPSCG
jgi:hypothetical protein